MSKQASDRSAQRWETSEDVLQQPGHTKTQNYLFFSAKDPVLNAFHSHELN